MKLQLISLIAIVATATATAFLDLEASNLDKRAVTKCTPATEGKTCQQAVCISQTLSQ